MAGRFQNVVLASAPRTFVQKLELHRLRAGGYQHMVVALTPRTSSYNNLQEFHRSEWSTHQKWWFGTIPDYAGANNYVDSPSRSPTT
eukprot:6006175-Pyramimonas_sp.AAC.1